MYIEKLYNGAFGLVELGIETFGDGVQVADLVKLPAFYDAAKEIYEAYPGAKTEIKTLTPEQVASLVNDFTNRLLVIINIPDAPTNNFKVDNSLGMLTDLQCIVDAVKMKVADGVQWDDVSALPYIISKLWDMITYMPEVKKELSELSKSEISLLVSTFVYKVYLQVLGV